MNDESNPLVAVPFDLQPKEKPVPGSPYIITEAPEGVYARYQDLVAKGTKFDAEGKPSYAGDHTGSANSILLAGCLFKELPSTNGNGRRQPMTIQEVSKWPARITQPLIQDILKMSEVSRRSRRTVDSVREEIAKLQEELARLEGGVTNDEDMGSEELAKNGQSATTATSV